MDLCLSGCTGNCPAAVPASALGSKNKLPHSSVQCGHIRYSMLLSSGGLGRSFTASFEATISQNGVKWFILHNAFRYRRSRAEISHSRQINFLRDPCGFESISVFDQSRDLVYVAGLRELALLRGLFQNKVNFNFTLAANSHRRVFTSKRSVWSQTALWNCYE